jgi:hypothetical protein
MRNIELLNKYIEEQGLTRKDLERITKVTQSQVSVLLNGKATWTRGVCDNLNRHFITDAFVPCVLNRETGVFSEWRPPKEPKKNTRANKYNVGDRVICLHDCRIHVVEKVKFIKARQEWVYYLDGTYDYIFENYLLDYKPKFNIGDKVLYNGGEAVVVDVLFEKKSYLYSILIDQYTGRYGILVEDYELEPITAIEEPIEDKVEVVEEIKEDVVEVVEECTTEESVVEEQPKIDPIEVLKGIKADPSSDNKDALKQIILGIVNDLLNLI